MPPCPIAQYCLLLHRSNASSLLALHICNSCCFFKVCSLFHIVGRYFLHVASNLYRVTCITTSSTLNSENHSFYHFLHCFCYFDLLGFKSETGVKCCYTYTPRIIRQYWVFYCVFFWVSSAHIPNLPNSYLIPKHLILSARPF